jgi:DNA-binding transcriptional LysR family regulator
LNLYKYFYEVAKYNSYTKAAESLMISQPSLSYSIKVLETQLERKLFIRENNKIKLTEDGEELYNRLDSIFKQFESVNEDDDYKGKITLGVRSAYAFRVLPFYIHEFSKLHPNLELDFIIARSDKLLSFLENKQIDILIDEQKVDEDGYKSVLQAKNKVVLFTTKTKASKLKTDVITLDYLKNKKISIAKRNYVTKEIKEMYPNLDYNEEASSPLMLVDIINNNGFGISPIAIISKELKKGDLVELKTDFPLPDTCVYLSYIKRLENKNIKCVVDFFIENQGKLIH